MRPPMLPGARPTDGRFTHAGTVRGVPMREPFFTAAVLLIGFIFAQHPPFAWSIQEIFMPPDANILPLLCAPIAAQHSFATAPTAVAMLTSSKSITVVVDANFVNFSKTAQPFSSRYPSRYPLQSRSKKRGFPFLSGLNHHNYFQFKI